MKPVKPDIPVLLCLPELEVKRHSCFAFLMLISRIPMGLESVLRETWTDSCNDRSR